MLTNYNSRLAYINFLLRYITNALIEKGNGWLLIVKERLFTAACFCKIRIKALEAPPTD